MSRIIGLPPSELVALLAVDARAYVRLCDAYSGDLVRASHHLAVARSVVAGTGAVPTATELHSAAVEIVVRLERFGASIEAAATSRVLADDARHLGLPVSGVGHRS